MMGMKLSLRERDHVVIVMPYFPHDSFHVSNQQSISLNLFIKKSYLSLSVLFLCGHIERLFSLNPQYL